MALGQIVGDLMMAVGLKADDQAFKEFEKDVDKVFDNVKSSGTKSSGGIAGAFKGAMPGIGTAVKGMAIGAAGAFTAVAGAAGVAGKKIFDMATETAAAGDRVDKMSQSLGLSREGFQEWDYILSQNGASIDSMKTGMTKLNKTMEEAAGGSDKAADKFKAIGLSMDDLKGKSREEIFEMTVAGLQGIQDEGQKAVLAQDLLGKASVDLAALLNGTAEGTEALKKNAHDMGMVMSDEAVAGAAGLTDSIDNLKRGFGGFKNKIAAEFLPGITGITDGLGMLLKGDFEGGADKIAAGLDGVITQAAEGLTKAVEVLGQLLPTLLPVLGEAAIGLMQTILDTITNNVDPLVATVIEIITMLQGFILKNLPMVISTGIDILVALALGIANAIPDLIPVMIEAIGAIITTLIDSLPLLIEAAFQIIEALAFGLIDAIPVLVAMLPQLIDSITNFIANNLPELIDMGIKIILALAGGIIDAIPQLVSQMPILLGSILAAIGGIIVGVVEIGTNIVKGVWKGISGAKDWLTGKVKGFFTGITDGVKGILGIHSPSRVYAGIGTNMGEGVGIGFDDSMTEVSKEIQASIPTNFDLDIDTDFTRTAKSTLITNYSTTAEDTEDEVKRQKQDAGRQSKDIKRDLHIHIDKAFGDKQGMRRFAQDFKEVLTDLGLETGDPIIA